MFSILCLFNHGVLYIIEICMTGWLEISVRQGFRLAVFVSLYNVIKNAYSFSNINSRIIIRIASEWARRLLKENEAILAKNYSTILERIL